MKKEVELLGRFLESTHLIQGTRQQIMGLSTNMALMITEEERPEKFDGLVIFPPLIHDPTKGIKGIIGILGSW